MQKIIENIVSLSALVVGLILTVVIVTNLKTYLLFVMLAAIAVVCLAVILFALSQLRWRIKKWFFY
jgi:Flp pilus assembly protein protease CpaA